MKKRFLALSLLSAASAGFAQGTVIFFNSPTTLISAGLPGQGLPISGPSGSYYFGLLIAPPGTTDVNRFVFTGVYATNSATPGRILQTSSASVVPGWPTGTDMSFFVTGWSASLGTDWKQQWMSGNFGAAGFFGFSTIGTANAGGPAGGIPFAPPYLFGGIDGVSGFNLGPVPEPSTAALIAMGAVVLARHFRGKMDRKHRSE